MIIIYREGQIIKYRVFYSLTFDASFKYVTFYYLSVLRKTIDSFDSRFSYSNVFHLTVSVL